MLFIRNKYFGGKAYNYDSTHNDKQKADSRAKILRDKGILARVVTQKISDGFGSYHRYQVYYHRGG